MSGPTLKARPTTYKGIRMRSRLEARYAALLDGVGELWTYEPRCFADGRGQYLPDFELHWAQPWFVEVKPFVDVAGPLLQRMLIVRSSEPLAGLILIDDRTPRTWYSPPGKAPAPHSDCPLCQRGDHRTCYEAVQQTFPHDGCRCSRVRHPPWFMSPLGFQECCASVESVGQFVGQPR